MKNSVSIPGKLFEANTAEANAFAAMVKQSSIDVIMDYYDMSEKEAVHEYDELFASVNQDQDYRCLSMEIAILEETSQAHAVVLLYPEKGSLASYSGFSFPLPPATEIVITSLI